jgi:magnesium-transporting ATPase (P-type)
MPSLTASAAWSHERTLTPAFTGYQVQKSEAILASFLAMIPPSCRVVRDGNILSIAAADLVKGDVVLLVGPFCQTVT